MPINYNFIWDPIKAKTNTISFDEEYSEDEKRI